MDEIDALNTKMERQKNMMTTESCFWNVVQAIFADKKVFDL